MPIIYPRNETCRLLLVAHGTYNFAELCLPCAFGYLIVTYIHRTLEIYSTNSDTKHTHRARVTESRKERKLPRKPTISSQECEKERRKKMFGRKLRRRIAISIFAFLPESTKPTSTRRVLNLHRDCIIQFLLCLTTVCTIKVEERKKNVNTLKYVFVAHLTAIHDMSLLLDFFCIGAFFLFASNILMRRHLALCCTLHTLALLFSMCSTALY